MSIEVHKSGHTVVEGKNVWLAVTENRWNKFAGEVLNPNEYMYYAFMASPGEQVREFHGESARRLFELYASI